MTTDRPAERAPTTVIGRAEILRAARVSKGLTLREAGDRLGIDFTYLSKIENGRERAGSDLIRRMGALYGRSFEQLLIEAYIDRIPAAVLDHIRREASASAATALREALEQLATDLRQYHDGGTLSLAAIDGMIADVDAALAAQPVAGSAESRWPSRDELAAVFRSLAYTDNKLGYKLFQGTGYAQIAVSPEEAADAILAALREDGEAREP